MTSIKYIGMDVHKESISIAVMNSVGKVVMECVIETKASMILQFFDGLRGDLHGDRYSHISAGSQSSPKPHKRCAQSLAHFFTIFPRLFHCQGICRRGTQKKGHTRERVCPW